PARKHGIFLVGWSMTNGANLKPCLRRIDHLINAKAMPVSMVMREIVSRKEGCIAADGNGKERSRTSRQMAAHEALEQNAVAPVTAVPCTLVRHGCSAMHRFRATSGWTAVSH